MGMTGVDAHNRQPGLRQTTLQPDRELPAFVHDPIWRLPVLSKVLSDSFGVRRDG